MKKSALTICIALAVVLAACQSPSNNDQPSPPVLKLSIGLPEALLPTGTPEGVGTGSESYAPKGYDAYSQLLTTARGQTHWAATFAALSSRILNETSLSPGETASDVTISVSESDINRMLLLLPPGLLAADSLETGSVTLTSVERLEGDDLLFEYGEGQSLTFDDGLDIMLQDPDTDAAIEVWLNWNKDLKVFAAIVYGDDSDFSVFYDKNTGSSTVYWTIEGATYPETTQNWVSYKAASGGTFFSFSSTYPASGYGTSGRGFASTAGGSLISEEVDEGGSAETREGFTTGGEVDYQAEPGETAGQWAAIYGSPREAQEDALNEAQSMEDDDWGFSWILRDWI